MSANPPEPCGRCADLEAQIERLHNRVAELEATPTLADLAAASVPGGADIDAARRSAAWMRRADDLDIYLAAAATVMAEELPEALAALAAGNVGRVGYWHRTVQAAGLAAGEREKQLERNAGNGTGGAL